MRRSRTRAHAQKRAGGLEVVEANYLVDGMLLTSEPPPGPPGIVARPVETAAELAATTAPAYEVFETPPEQRGRPAAEEFERLSSSDYERVYGAWIDGRLAGTARA